MVWMRMRPPIKFRQLLSLLATPSSVLARVFRVKTDGRFKARLVVRDLAQ